MPTKKPQIKAYIVPELKEKFELICKNENRSESNMIEYLIQNYVREWESKHERTELKGKLSESKIG